MPDSDEEPAAIRGMPPGETRHDWRLKTHLLGNEPVRYNSAALARDLSGAHAVDFDAFEFVRGLLGDASELDGNAALAALDGVEHMLRKRRSIAASDENFAREQLRIELRNGLRKRDNALKVVDASDNYGDASQCVRELRGAVLTLEELVVRHSKLINARDIVRLLEGDVMDVERATEVLALLRMEERKGSLEQVLDDERYQKAKKMIERVENQLLFRNAKFVEEDEREPISEVPFPL